MKDLLRCPAILWDAIRYSNELNQSHQRNDGISNGKPNKGAMFKVTVVTKILPPAKHHSIIQQEIHNPRSRISSTTRCFKIRSSMIFSNNLATLGPMPSGKARRNSRVCPKARKQGATRCGKLNKCYNDFPIYQRPMCRGCPGAVYAQIQDHTRQECAGCGRPTAQLRTESWIK